MDDLTKIILGTGATVVIILIGVVWGLTTKRMSKRIGIIEKKVEDKLMTKDACTDKRNLTGQQIDSLQKEVTDNASVNCREHKKLFDLSSETNSMVAEISKTLIEVNATLKNNTA